MNATELAQTIESRIKAALPECYVSVKYSNNLYPMITLTFAKGANKAAWSNGIIQNDPLWSMSFIDGITKDGELLPVQKLESHCNNNHKYLPLRGKTATADKLVDYIERYFLRVRAIL